MPGKILVYGHAACPKVPPLRLALWASKVDYEYIDIHRDHDAATRVKEINHGYESVPTLVFPDGSNLTEPGYGDLKAALASQGYRLNPLSWLAANLGIVIIGGLVLIILLRILGVF